jgi:hypothetical protein
VRHAVVVQPASPRVQAGQVRDGQREVVQADPALVEAAGNRAAVVADADRQPDVDPDQEGEPGFLDHSPEAEHLDPEPDRRRDVVHAEAEVGQAVQCWLGHRLAPRDCR